MLSPCACERGGLTLRVRQGLEWRPYTGILRKPICTFRHRWAVVLAGNLRIAPSARRLWPRAAFLIEPDSWHQAMFGRRIRGSGDLLALLRPWGSAAIVGTVMLEA